jgi:hypothetical protein
MKNQPCVSFEMADRLKEAGYPQPKMEVIGRIAFWMAYGFFYRQGALLASDGFIFDKGDTYAPTAFELLPEGWTIANLDNGWHVHLYDVGGPTFIHENPHDAAAMAWLWEKENGA